jgi:hypothetical protein
MWYKCKACDSKLKLMVDENDRCSVNLKLEHDFHGHLHEGEGEDEDDIVHY